MKLGLVTLLLLIAACAPPQTYRPGPVPYSESSASGATAESGSAGVTTPSRPATSYSQDAVECERKAALSQAGSKGEAFAKCMREKGHTPGRN